MPKSRVFTKPPYTYSQLVDKLQIRGLNVDDSQLAEKHLQNIGYYRLIGYGLSFELYEGNERLGKYKPGTEFQHLVDIYSIDRKIRNLLLIAVEQIEVSIRNIINHELAVKYNDAHWYTQQSLFESHFKHDDLLKEIDRSSWKKARPDSEQEKKREAFIQHYYNHYDSPEYPPCWMVAEILSLGSWSKIYASLAISADRKLISKQLNLSPKAMKSWLHVVTYMRNMCAHHSRLFGRKFVIRPYKNSNDPFNDENRLFNYIYVTYKLLHQISPESQWLQLLSEEFDLLDDDLLKYYGFAPDWQKHFQSE